MDLRDIIRNQSSVVVGHKAVGNSLNFNKETERFSKNHLEKLLVLFNDTSAEFTNGDIGRYLQAYSWYVLCLKRALKHISLSRRVQAGLRYHPRNVKYSSYHKELSHKYREFNQYIELDYQNLIIHSCILLDRVITLTRRFIVGGNLPSFTSFNKHKQFLKKSPNPLDMNHHAYVKYISTETDWFEIPLKVLRDKFLMHSSEKYMSFLGWGQSNWDLEMVTVISAEKNQDELFRKVRAINFTPRRLARDIETFLKWYSNYAITTLN